MTKQTYKSAQGKTIDLGTIKLRNEHVRAVGNMNVNARGDVLDSNNQIIEPKSRQIQRQNARLTNVVDTTVHTSSAAAKRARRGDTLVPTTTLDTPLTEAPDPVSPAVDPTPTATVSDVSAPVTVDAFASDVAPIDSPISLPSGGGLAAAIARSKIIKQEKEKTARQQLQQTPGVRKI